MASDPANACNLVNGVLDEYIKYQDEDLKGRNRVLIKLLDDEATDRLLEVTSKRNLVRQLAQELPTGMLAPEMGPEQMVQQADANELAQQLAELEFDRTVLRATIASMEQTSPHSDTIVPETVLDEIVATDEEVQRLSAELKYAQDTLQGIREGSTLAEQQQRKINQLEAQLKKWSEQLREEQRIALRRRGRAALDAETNSKIDQLRAEMTVNESMTQLVREKLNVYQAKIQGASSKIVELEIARRDLNRAEDVYDRLNQRINDLRTENRAPARVNLVRKATVPRSPVELIPWKQLMAVSLATFALPFAVALLWEFRSQRVAGVGEIQGSMRLPVLAEITCLPRHPRLPHRNARESYDGQRAAFENSIHYLSRNLLLTLDSNNQSVFAVTSAVSGEGKTNLASVLSISMAIGTHESVLLIDADLRRPNTHTMFDLDLSPGLADVLTENCNDDDAIHATPADGVFVMPAGQLGKHPHSVLRSDRFAAVLERVRTRFRYVIVDTPPVLSVGETLSVCKLVDAVILSTMRDVSRRNQVEEAYNRLCGAGASVCGVVLNGVAVKSYASRYGDYYFTS